MRRGFDNPSYSCFNASSKRWRGTLSMDCSVFSRALLCTRRRASSCAPSCRRQIRTSACWRVCVTVSGAVSGIMARRRSTTTQSYPWRESPPQVVIAADSGIHHHGAGPVAQTQPLERGFQRAGLRYIARQHLASTHQPGTVQTQAQRHQRTVVAFLFRMSKLPRCGCGRLR